jgi:hypothetical protein
MAARRPLDAPGRGVRRVSTFSGLKVRQLPGLRPEETAQSSSAAVPNMELPPSEV